MCHNECFVDISIWMIFRGTPMTWETQMSSFPDLFQMAVLGGTVGLLMGNVGSPSDNLLCKHHEYYSGIIKDICLVL